MLSRAGAPGTSLDLRLPVLWAPPMAFCKALGLLEWWKLFGPSLQFDAGGARDFNRAEGRNKFASSHSSKFIQTVEGRDLISFRQRRIVENRVTEIFDGRSHRQHRLSNVYYLGGSFTDNMNAQQFQRIWIEQYLQKSLVVA